jgi:hypothetical protein
VHRAGHCGANTTIFDAFSIENRPILPRQATDKHIIELWNALIEQVHNAGTFATGLLAGGFSYVYQDAPPEMLAKTEQWCGKKAVLAQFDGEHR